MTSKIHLFTRVTVAKAKSVVANPDEPADPEGGGGFAEWAMLTLHALRIELGKSYRVAVDLLSEMPGILEEIGLTKLPHYTVLRTWFERIPTKTWRAFLGNAGDLRSLAADRGYDAKAFRDELRENGIRPLIKHRIMNPLDHAHNARMDGDRYHQRSMSETVFSSIKRTLGAAVRARSCVAGVP